MGEPESQGSANLRSVLLAELSTASLLVQHYHYHYYYHY